MRLVIGRSNARKDYDLLHGTQFVRGMKDEPEAARLAIDNICRMLGVMK